MTNTEKAAQAYKEAALWTEEELMREDLEGTDKEGAEFAYTIWDFTREASDSIEAEVDRFITDALLLDVLDDDEDYEQFGHDLWLTRNGHGTGFWDRGTGSKGEALTEAAKELGEATIWPVGNHIMYESNQTITKRLEA